MQQDIKITWQRRKQAPPIIRMTYRYQGVWYHKYLVLVTLVYGIDRIHMLLLLLKSHLRSPGLL